MPVRRKRIPLRQSPPFKELKISFILQSTRINRVKGSEVSLRNRPVASPKHRICRKTLKIVIRRLGVSCSNSRATAFCIFLHIRRRIISIKGFGCSFSVMITHPSHFPVFGTMFSIFLVCYFIGRGTIWS